MSASSSSLRRLAIVGVGVTLAVGLPAAGRGGVATPSRAAAAPKPGILFNLGGTSGNVHIGTARGALPTFVFLVNNTAKTVKGIRLQVLLPGQRILSAGLAAKPAFSLPVKKTRVGTTETFTLPPLKPKVAVTVTVRAALLRVKVGRFCPGYAVFTAPGWKTTKQPITCFTITP